MVAYTGRHLEPDFLALQQAQMGKELIVLKEIGILYLFNLLCPN